MTGPVDFATGIEFLFSTGAALESDPRLTDLLEEQGFVYPERSAVNLRLLEPIFPPKMLGDIAHSSLSTPLPDLALNGLERICSVAAHEDLVAVCRKRERLTQLLNICGSSSFLTVVLCRNPVYFKELFILNSIDIRRTEQESLASLRTMISEETSYPEIFPILRRFKYREMLRIAARDLNGLAPLEEVTAELSALAAATLQIAYEVAHRRLVAEHGIPLMQTPAGMQEAEMVIIGMGKLGGRELNFSSDIDLICFYSSDKGETSGIESGTGDPKGKVSLHVFFVKLAEMITKAISQVTEDGFVFRTDLGLPEGKGGRLYSLGRKSESGTTRAIGHAQSAGSHSRATGASLRHRTVICANISTP
jgi:glutamate-ammonia-ligase adenylyltransferase